MATIIDPLDFNRYEVIKASSLINDPLRVVLDSGTANKPASVDAFGRLRVANGFTLFDSSHRYNDNGQWATAVASSGTATFNSNQGLVDLAVTTTSGSKVYRETTKTFSYQPGKSLLVMSTFVFNPSKTNLRQRVGYFNAANGIYLEQDGTTISLVKRSSVTGSVVETKVTKASWNVDPLDGTGTSGLNLDLTKAQILWADIEWLGVGSVRIGFVIDGKFIVCHTFNHANSASTTYITTACLPLRYEIENTGTTASASALKQICSAVISEGGYELSGQKRSVSTPFTTAATLTTAGTLYSVLSLRLKSTPDRLDAIVILSALSIMGVTNNANYKWQIVSGGTTSGGTWTSVATNSAVEYKVSGGTLSGGTTLTSGFSSASNQFVSAVDVLKASLFTFQLERDGLAGTPYELTLAVTSDVAGAALHAALGFEEITK